MRIFVFWLCSTLVLVMQASAGNLTIPVVDKSSPGSPIKNGGTVTVSSRIANGKVFLSHQDDWKAQNISRLPIVALVEVLTIQFPDGYVISVDARYEAFFHPTLIDPSKEADLWAPSSGETADPYGSEDPGRPNCEAKLLWVQFADGSTFGDEKYSVDLLRDRKETWAALAHLDAVYKSKGADAFLEELKKPADPEAADDYIQHIRNFQQQNGTEAAAQRLEMHLKIAEERAPLTRTAIE